MGSVAAIREGRDISVGNAIYWLMACCAILGLVLIGYAYLPQGEDWSLTFRPATLAFLSGQSPYTTVEHFFNAPWLLLALTPFAILPEELGRALLFVLALFSLAFTARRLGAGLVATVALLVSPPTLFCLQTGSLDWLVILGAVLPQPVGLLLLLSKPQLGGALALFWMIEAARQGGLFRLVWPTLVLSGLSLVYGPWPLKLAEAHIESPVNASLWPASLVVGLPLLVVAFLKCKERYALAASPFLSPYVVFYSWITPLAALAHRTRLMVAVVAGLWILVIVRLLYGV